MKKLTIIILLFILSGCTTSPPVFEEVLITKGIDFVKYSDEGFLFTTEEYRGDYSSVGIVQVNYIPKAVFRPGDPITYSRPVYSPVIQDKIDLEKYEILYPNSDRTINGMRIVGFAIKRIGAFK